MPEIFGSFIEIVLFFTVAFTLGVGATIFFFKKKLNLKEKDIMRFQNMEMGQTLKIGLKKII